MTKKLKAVFLFDTSSVKDLQIIRNHILEDNRRFAVRWSVVQFFYGALCLVLSYYKENFTRCREVYVMTMAVSVMAFIFSKFLTKINPLMVYLGMLFNYVSAFGSGLLIARILLQDKTVTVMLFAAALIAPVLFITNTLLNILVATVDIAASVILLTSSLPRETYGWCLTYLLIFSSMGVVIGHFVNKSRYERYVFAESAVQLADSNAKLAELQTKYAYYDQMTGLKNRRAYSEKVEELANGMDNDCCLIMMDSNGLKKVNDTYGHFAGDELIVATADCLRKAFEGEDNIYRLGGDEFCVILNATKQETENKLKTLDRLCAEWKGKYMKTVSVSYGYASSEEFDDIESMVNAADKRMYAYKNNYHKTFDPVETKD